MGHIQLEKGEERRGKGRNQRRSPRTANDPEGPGGPLEWGGVEEGHEWTGKGGGVGAWGVGGAEKNEGV